MKNANDSRTRSVLVAACVTVALGLTTSRGIAHEEWVIDIEESKPSEIAEINVPSLDSPKRSGGEETQHEDKWGVLHAPYNTHCHKTIYIGGVPYLVHC